jgi:hypothetical protein
MKIKDPVISALSLLVLISLTGAIAGCFWKGDEVKFSKVSDPEGVSAACTQKQGLDQDLTAKLSRAFKNNDGEITDEFKLEASSIVSEADSVPAAGRNAVLKEYFSCLASSAPAEKK